MFHCFDPLREPSLQSILLRLCLSLLFGGLLGMDREQKRYPAGLRTYMLVCLGSCLTMILSQFQYLHLYESQSQLVMDFGLKLDVSRYGAQVISGIGFLGAGIILINQKQEVKGLTTAASLWASACMGLAIGAGFYECTILGFLIIFTATRYLPFLSEYIIDRSRYMTIYLEFESISNIRPILQLIRNEGISVYEVDLERGREKKGRRPRARLSLGLKKGMKHTELLFTLSELSCMKQLEEV